VERKEDQNVGNAATATSLIGSDQKTNRDKGRKASQARRTEDADVVKHGFGGSWTNQRDNFMGARRLRLLLEQ